MCNGISETINGRNALPSLKESSTRFDLAPFQESETKVNHASHQTAGRCWMIVDDNTDILSVMRGMVSTFRKNEIECYASPVKALAALTANPDKFELVITDFEMPVMNGVELGRRMLASAPAIKILLASGRGFFREEFARHAGFSAMLNKPFPLNALRAALAKAGMETTTPASAN